MRRVANGLSVLTMAPLLMTAAACGRPTPAPNAGQTPGAGPGGPADVDRTSLPLAEPTRPAITELDARNVKTPPIFEVKAPANAPNVIVILLDNFGYAGSETFGGVMNLPTLKRLANNESIYNNFHTAPICSASRLALLTGRNPHSANMGTVSEMATASRGRIQSCQTAWRPSRRSCASTYPKGDNTFTGTIKKVVISVKPDAPKQDATRCIPE